MELIKKINEVNEVLSNNFALRLESAAVALGLANTSGLPLRIYAQNEVDLPNVEVKVVDDINSFISKSVSLVNGIRCMNLEMTICEMLKEYSDPQTITESMCFYYYSYGVEEDWGILPKIAKKYGVLHEFESFVDDAIEHANY